MVVEEKESQTGVIVSPPEAPFPSPFLLPSAAFRSMVFPLPGGPQRRTGVEDARKVSKYAVSRAVSAVGMTRFVSVTAEGGRLGGEMREDQGLHT